MADSQLMLIPESGLSFGAALQVARSKLAFRLGLNVSARTVAASIDMPHQTYSTYEKDVRLPSKPAFDRIRDFYLPYFDIIEDLSEVYARYRQKPAQVVPFIFGISGRQDDVEEAIWALGSRSLKLYDSGRVKEAAALVNANWTHVLRHGHSLPATVNFGFVAARIASQMNNHILANQVMALIRERAPASGRPLQAGYHALYEPTYCNREFMLDGCSGARAFETTLARIEHLSGTDRPDLHPMWKWIWNHTWRSLVISLSDSYGEDEAAYLSNVREDYMRSAQSVDAPDYGQANELIQERIAASVGNPAKALEAINNRDMSKVAIGDRMFAMRSLAVALHRCGETDRAVGHIEECMTLCRGNNMRFKYGQFMRLKMQITRRF